jgi:hypothetical protein
MNIMVVPDYTSDIISINNLISDINQSIIELQDLIGDNNNIDLTDINDSIASFTDDVHRMNCPRLITARVSTLETNKSDKKTFIGTIINSNSKVTSI